MRADKAIPAAVTRGGRRARRRSSPALVATSVRELATVVSIPGTGGAARAVGARPAEGGRRRLSVLRRGGDGPQRAARRACSIAEGVLVAPELCGQAPSRARERAHESEARTFVVRGRILSEPDKVNVSLTLGPRVMLSLAGFERTGLEAFGSRIDRVILVKLGTGAGAADVEAAAKIAARGDS